MQCYTLLWRLFSYFSISDPCFIQFHKFNLVENFIIFFVNDLYENYGRFKIFSWAIQLYLNTNKFWFESLCKRMLAWRQTVLVLSGFIWFGKLVELNFFSKVSHLKSLTWFGKSSEDELSVFYEWDLFLLLVTYEDIVLNVFNWPFFNWVWVVYK